MKRQNVKDIIRGLLHDHGSVSSVDVQRALGITRQAAHHHLKELVRAGEIELYGAGRGARYRTPLRRTIRRGLEGLEEHLLWNELLESDVRVRRVPENVAAILRYAFTEMVNNAIDHSRGSFVEITSAWIDDAAVFDVEDDGVGAFRTVQAKFGLPDLFAAVQELSKGKRTTDPDRHSGEGIFFTSKCVDRFVLEANGLRWTVDNDRVDQAVGDAASRRGTRVHWRLDEHASRQLSDVFGPYTDPETFDFTRTQAVVRIFRSGASFVSRSEAKRVAHGLERFREVRIDFTGVRDVGQGFVDELFRVWATANPGTRLTPTDMSPAVRAMVRRGLPPGR